MFIVNEHAYTSISRTPNVFKSALKDIEFFVQSTHHQLQSDIFDSLDDATERMKTDMEGELACHDRFIDINEQQYYHFTKQT